jgi:hypothetical protein
MTRLEPDIPTVLRAFNHIKDSQACPLDEGLLEPRIDDDGEIEVYCLSCSWKQTLGLDAKLNLVLQYVL